MLAILSQAVFLFFFPSLVLAVQDPDQVIAELDHKYYYPQQQGLTRLSFRITLEQLDTKSENGRFLRLPDVQFFWKRGDGDPDLTLAEPDKSISKANGKTTLNLLENLKEAFIPTTLMDRFRNQRGRIKSRNSRQALLEFEPKDPDHLVNKYQLFVDLKNNRVEKIRLARKTEPRLVKGEFRYILKEEKWLVSEAVSRYWIGEAEYTERLKYFYKKVRSLWLVSKIIQSIKTEGRTVQSLVLRTSRFRFIGEK